MTLNQLKKNNKIIYIINHNHITNNFKFNNIKRFI